MNHKTYTSVTMVIFTIVALLHVARIVWGFDLTIGTWSAPLWLSWIGAIVAAFLAYTAYKFQR